MELKPLAQQKDIALYEADNRGAVQWLVATTPETRAICNDPFVLGVDYTRKLQNASTKILTEMEKLKILNGDEMQSVVLHILRGGLNFNLRNALHDAFGWNKHLSAFISSQRAKDEKGGWYITENRYQKVAIPDNGHIIFGDVVATGTSLEHALLLLIDIATKQDKEIRAITFFTIGGKRAGEIIEKVDAVCRERFPNYTGSQVIFLEGIFGVADEESPLQIALSGTDLLRSPALMAPEFIKSQDDALQYALERCTIYDAGSRAFQVKTYLRDVHEYWTQVAELARKGTTLPEYLKERYPEDARLNDKEWVKEHDSSDALLNIAEQQIQKAEV